MHTKTIEMYSFCTTLLPPKAAAADRSLMQQQLLPKKKTLAALEQSFVSYLYACLCLNTRTLSHKYQNYSKHHLKSITTTAPIVLLATFTPIAFKTCMCVCVYVCI